jgi:two-component system response regulator
MIYDNVDILYVEDDPADVELTAAALRRGKVANTIHVSRDGVEALDFLFCRGPHADREFFPPKFVLLDFKLPRVNGLEVLKAIRNDARTALTPVVIMTSSNEQRDMVDSYKLHVNSYIQKPLDFAKFQSIVQQLGRYWLVVNQPVPAN